MQNWKYYIIKQLGVAYGKCNICKKIKEQVVWFKQIRNCMIKKQRARYTSVQKGTRIGKLSKNHNIDQGTKNCLIENKDEMS